MTRLVLARSSVLGRVGVRRPAGREEAGLAQQAGLMVVLVVKRGDWGHRLPVVVVGVLLEGSSVTEVSV